MKKGQCKVSLFVAGAAYGIFDYLVGFLVWGLVFQEATVAHAHLWRSQDDPLMKIGMPIASIFIGLTIALAYCALKDGLVCPQKGELTPVKKGIMLGFILWLIFGLAHNIFWYTLSPISPTILAASIIHSAISLVLGTALIAKIMSRSSGECATSCSTGQENK